MTAYEIEGPDRDAAAKVARFRFCSAFGFEYKDTESYVMYNETRQAEDLKYYRDHGLPDEIPS